MKRKLRTNPTPARTPAGGANRTKVRARLAVLLVAALAVAYVAASETSLAQTKRKKPAREKMLQSETPPGSASESGVAVPKRSAPERPSAGKGAGRRTRQQEEDGDLGERRGARRGNERAEGRVKEQRLRRGRPFRGDVRQLPQTKPVKAERPEREGPEPTPGFYVPPGGKAPAEGATASAPAPAPAAAQAPPPNVNFEGLDFNNWGAGHPPDTVGDVGPNHYVQSINSSVAIYDKVTGTRLAAFTLNALMSQGSQGNLCDTNNSGDPVILYDTFEDRWVISDFAFQSSGPNVANPPGAFQCFAVSRTGDPVAGGWNFYSINTTGGLGDYPKLGVWPDGIYMSVNMFTYVGSVYLGPRVYAFNKAQMYAGAPTVQSVAFDGPAADFTMLPSNARLQTGTPPTGTPNYFLSTWRFLNALTVYKMKVDWTNPAASTFTGPDIPLAATGWPNAGIASVPSQGGNNLDTLHVRAMMQNQYTNIGGAESLWAIHTVRRADTTGNAAPRFYQLQVNGGTVSPNVTQAATFDPDGANLIHRFMPSLAVDRAGNMALGYSTSSSTTKPALKYAGRLATDPIETFSQTEQTLIQGAGTQTGNCGGGACARWGDYAAMSLDPDGCTFWFTSMYYAVDGLDHRTRVGSFNLPQCTPVGSGGLQGNVTSTAGGGPVAGATVSLGSRTATTDAAGFYSFPNLPAGTYPTMTAGFPGYTSGSAAGVVVNEGALTVQNFALSPGANSACLTDTTLADFQVGVPAGVDLTSSPGDVKLPGAGVVDQQNLSLSNSGAAISAATWGGQTFQPAVNGQLTRVDVNLFCFSCTGTTPNLTVSIRATAGDLPTGPDLATATITGFNSGVAAFRTANFASPPTLNAGTRYAYVVRPVANTSAGTYAITASTGSPYANGRRVSSANSGGTWAGATTDTGFTTFMKTGAGSFVSSLKDANPRAGGTVSWTTLSWNADTPAGTSVKFQVAAGNSALGPFSFVGPDGTAATFFTASGASLSQFNGRRYLKYRAVLETTNLAVAPTLNDVSVCYDNTVPTTLAVGPASGAYGGTVNLSATLTDGVSPLAGKTVSFSLNGNGVGSAVTDAAGVASLADASLAGIGAGSYPSGVGAGFAGDATYIPSSATNALTVNSSGLTIKADDKSRLLGAPNPPFTATYTGFVNGDGPGSLAGTLVFNTTATPASPVGTYPIVPSGVTSTNYQITFVNGTLSVGFNVCVDYDETKARQSGSIVPVKLRLCDASGANQSSSSIDVQAVYVVDAVTNAPQTLGDAGNANPGNYFRFDGGGYIYNLKTTGYAPGTYTLGFTAAGDPTPHAVQFVIK